MRGWSSIVAASLICLGSYAVKAQTFDTPLYINLGGPEVVDSFGRTWLGDEGAGADPLDIRPDDAGGANVIPGWCDPAPATISSLVADVSLGVTFNPGHPGDTDLFRSIRWDTGAAAPDYILEIPVAAGEYTTTLYFCENCCTNRHETILIQGEVAFPDVSVDSYAGGATHTPGLHSKPDVIVGDDGILNITLLGCPPADCPGGGDINPTLTALSIVPSGFDPCSDENFRSCPSGLACSVDGDGNVTGSWSAPVCIEAMGYEVLQDGALIASLPGDATSFTATTAARFTDFTVKTVLAEGEPPCLDLTCNVVQESAPFEVPVRINMGGGATVDSLGREWLGDGPGAGDPLSIRPDDAGGSNWIVNWCSLNAVVEFDALQALGLDPFAPSDVTIFNTIRWDNGADAANFDLEIPVPDGDYLVNLYFNECGGPNRHFQIEIQGEIVDDDVSSADYSAVATPGRTGLLSFDGISVAGGPLSINLLPCPDCPGATDVNAILNAIEILPAGSATPVCPRQLICALDEISGEVRCSWMPAENVSLTGYEVYRNGEKIADLDAAATEYADASPACARASVYELVPLVDGESPCPELALVSTLIQPDCAFAAPVRLNMGGRQVLDSAGQLWLADGPGAGDPLGIRPNDVGGNNWIEAWALGNFQPDSFDALGLDANHLGDVYIFNTIRWDNGGDAPNFIMDLPLDPGIYDVNMWFTEGCCVGRNFKIQLQGAIVDDNVSYLDYDPDNPAVGRTGMLGFGEILVLDNLQVSLLPCPECPRPTGVGADNNAIIDALEVVRTGDLPDGVVVQLGGDCNQDGSQDIADLICSVGALFPGFVLLDRSRETPCDSAAGTAGLLDINGDDVFNAADLISYAEFLFNGGAAPVQGMNCGPIAAPGCAESASCP